MELAIFWVIMALICAIVAGQRQGAGMAVVFFLFGLILWPIALVGALLLSRRAAAD